MLIELSSAGLKNLNDANLKGVENYIIIMYAKKMLCEKLLCEEYLAQYFYIKIIYTFHLKSFTNG